MRPVVTLSLLRAATPVRCEGARAVLRALHVAPSRRMREAAVAAAMAAAAASETTGASAANTGRERKAAAWHPSLERYGAGQVNDRYRLAFMRGMSERAWLGWAAVKLATEIALRPGSSDLGAALLDAPAFDGHKGRPLRIRASDGQLLQPLYVIRAGSDTGMAAPLLAEIATPLPADSSSGARAGAPRCG